jgi:hypothetical protein
MTYDWTTELPGVVSVHTDECPVRDGHECACGPLGFRASTRNQATNVRTVSSSFPSIPEALSWKRDQIRSESDPETSAGQADRTRLAPLIEDFLQAAEDGLARDAYGQPYSLEQLRVLRGGLSYAESELGRMAVGDVRRRDVQGLVAQLRAAGVDGTRIVGVVDGLSELYSYAIRNDLVGFSPVVELDFSEPETGAGYVDTLQPSVRHAAHTGGPEPSIPPQWDPEPQPAPRHARYDEFPAASQGFHAASPGYPGYPGSQGFPAASQGYPGGSQGYPPMSQGYPGGSQGYPPTPQGYPASSQGFPASPFGSSGFATGGFMRPPASPQAQNDPSGSGSYSAAYDATMQERWLWWTVRIIVIVFVLIALVLVAESV